ncbi:hypothetical protein NBRC13296_12290 [Paenibacillus chitinolyticus]|uniref:hypothetical protein n=1 Tax=Paenibacillus chitinolyticus TaxID=79263 RepID=UPI003557718D
MLITILGRSYDVDKYDVKSYIAFMDDLIENMHNPFIINLGGLPEYRLTSKLHHNEIYGVCDYIESFADGIEGFRNKMNHIATPDEEWNIWRNREYTSDYYVKYTLKPQIVDAAKVEFIKLRKQLQDIKDQFEAEKLKKETEKAERMKLYSIGQVYQHTNPKGGENGVDGFFDADIINNNSNESVRFIVKDIFDVGIIIFPKRFGGSEEAIDQSKWNEDEIKIRKWLYEYKVFERGIRM